MKARTLIVLCSVVASLSGCALPPVQPWEKGQLARTDMLLQGDPLGARFNEHIYASKEAASGGSAVGGGGCGCN
ncbi:DUF4266 domain-containing protein [Duganella sp. FT135W]|uniref:DUF4266 domain-containing protein n=1 Tax=Duganella flavida TaxID=2692175 RepID=A0A6L8KDS3_9BURK|nr:DUF4266 domain-containing protein [Duganella flavida]MYM25629.1 DUF4266 domain-containing protein [Duganella flavida]